jgi:hypothetical protein
MRVDSTRIILFPITRRRVKSTRTAAHESYRPACRIDTPFFTVLIRPRFKTKLKIQ